MNERSWVEILDAAPDAIVVVDEGGRMVLVNRQTERLFGYGRDELLGQPVELLVPVRFRGRHAAERNAYVGHPTARPMSSGLELYGRHRDGSEFPVEISLSPLRSDGGPLTVAAVRDMRERRRIDAEQAELRRAQAQAEARADVIQRLQALTDTMLAFLPLEDLLPELVARVRATLQADTVGLLLLDSKGEELEVRASTGLRAGGATGVRMAVGQGFAGRIAAERRSLAVEDVENAQPPEPALREAGVRSALGVPLLVEGGLLGVLHVGSLSRRHFTDEERRLLELVADRVSLVVDHVRLYEAERQARAEAEAANRAKDEFLATLSHELRSPLQAILGWAQMLYAAARDPVIRRATDAIQRNARAQSRLIADLLDVSRIISGRLTLELAPITLAPVVRSAVESFRPEAEAKTIALRFDADGAQRLVEGDGGRLRQVVDNLLSNAIRFTGEGGRVDVELRHEADHAIFRVRDTGSGIPADFLPRLFERFSRREDPPNSRHAGLGLGLAIVKHLVDLHGGSVRAESAGEGRGATFTVTLPLLDPSIVASTPRSTDAGREPGLPRLDGVRVLVVDDEADAREVLQTMLESCGAAVRTAGSAREALAALETAPADVLLSDIAMPETDGYVLLRDVRRRHNLPAAALTAYAGQDDRRRALQAGFEEHLAKPVNAVELAAVVARLAGRDR